jgi:hypothetical protein
MALVYKLPVYDETRKLVLLIHQTVTQFSREYKYTLGQDMRHGSEILLVDLFRINKAIDKAPVLDGFIDDFELVKIRVRIAYDLRLISTGKYAQIAESMESIGKQISGWRKKAGTC